MPHRKGHKRTDAKKQAADTVPKVDTRGLTKEQKEGIEGARRSLRSLRDRAKGEPAVPERGGDKEFTPPETSPDVEAARKRLRGTFQPTERETQTRERLDELISGGKAGRADIREQPIPQPLIRGQAAALQRQTLAKAEPLERRLSRLQQQRQAEARGARAELGFAERDVERTTQARQRFEERQRQETEGLAKRQRERRSAIQEIALEARERGAESEDIDAILQAETVDEAIQAAAQFRPVEENEFVQRSLPGGGIVELEVDPQGQVVNQRVIRAAPEDEDEDEDEAEVFTQVQEKVSSPEGQQATYAELFSAMQRDTDLNNSEISGILEASGRSKNEQRVRDVSSFAQNLNETIDRRAKEEDTLFELESTVRERIKEQVKEKVRNNELTNADGDPIFLTEEQREELLNTL